MAPESPNPPLRILLACARPLILKVEEWEAELKDPATRHIAAAATALQGVADIGRFRANGRTMGFELYPPRPPAKVIQEKLAAAIPLDTLKVASKAIPLDVHTLDEEIEAIQNGLQGLQGVELYVHPAATPAEVLAFLQKNDVDVLQFAGHGDETGGLYFEDGRGSARRVTPDELARLVQRRIKLLFTGACYSAQALSALFPPGARDGHAIPAALAVDGQHPIPSRAVQLFATAFYASLARGRRVQTSFNHGVEAVRQDDLIGERRLPDDTVKVIPTPWKRFHLYGDTSLAWKPNKNSESAITRLVKPTLHRKLPRTDELFVGRNVEIAATVEKLEPPRPGMAEHKPRIVTLHGEGGIGKTRLAGAVAEWLAERGQFPGGIIEVDCERAGSSVELAIAILAALGADQPERLPDPPRALVEGLRQRDRPLLLLLDNLDNLFANNGSVPGPLKTVLSVTPTLTLRQAQGRLFAHSFDCAQDRQGREDNIHPGRLLKECLTTAPTLRLLSTCRWPLNLGSDEDAFEVDPLRREEAERLFILSVHHKDLRDNLLRLNPEHRGPLLLPILDATERMPLALVLAARRLTDPGEDLATTIRRASHDLVNLCDDQSLSHLPPRLRSVRASLQLSYDRLSDPAKRLFARMSFFPGGLVRGFEPLSEFLGGDWPELLREEVAFFALARYDRDGDRYTLLNPVREFAREKLDSAEGDDFRRQAVAFWIKAAATYVPLLAPSQAPSELLAVLKLPDEPEKRQDALEQWRQRAFGLLISQEDNIIGAAVWALAEGGEAGADLLSAIDAYLDLRALWHTQEQLYDLAARRPPQAGEEARALLWQGNKANVLNKLRRWDEARATYEGTLQVFRSLAQADPDAYLPNVATTLNNLGALLDVLGEREAARQHYQEALGLRRQLASQYPDAYLPNLAMTLNNLGALLADLGEREPARQHYQEALGLRRQLASRYPDAYLPNVAGTLNNLGALLAGLGEREAARQHYQEALGLYRELASRYPDAYLSHVATTLNNLGNLLAGLGEREAARQHYQEALGLYRQLASRYPDAYLPNVAMTLNNLGALLAGLGEREAARQHYQEALGLYRQLASRYPDAYLPDVAMTLNNLGNLLAGLGEREAARQHYQEALSLYRQLASRYPDAYLPNLAMTLNNLGALLADLGEREAARQHYQEALSLRRRLASRYPDAYLPDVAMTLNNLGNLLANLGEREAARQHYEETLEIYQSFFQKFPNAFRRNLLIVLNGLRRVYEELGRKEQAEQCRMLMEQLLGEGGQEGLSPPP